MSWTNIPNALVAVGAKPFASTLQALRDNIIALALGEALAPRIRQGAFERISAGDEIRSRVDAVFENTSGSFTVYQTAHFFGFAQHGAIRVTWEDSGTANPYNWRLRRVRAGEETSIDSGGRTSTTYLQRTYDVDVIPGDVLLIQVSGTNGGVGRIRNARFMTDGEDLIAFGGANVEGNRAAT